MLGAVASILRLPDRPSARSLALATLVVAVALALAMLPLPLAAALVAGVGVVVLVLAQPQWALYLLVFSVPFESLRQFNIGGASVGSTEFLVALLALAWGARVATNRDGLYFNTALTLPLILVLAAVGLSTLRAVALPPAVKEGVRWLEILVVYVVAADLLRVPRRRAILLGLLLLAGVLEALLGFAQFLFRLGPESFRTGGFLRAYGTFGQPNPYAGYLGTLLPLGVALALTGWSDRVARQQLWFYLALGALGLLAGAMAASMSRGGWLGLALALAVLASLTRRRVLLTVLAGVLGGVFMAALGALDLLPSQITQRLTQIVSYFGVFDVRTVVLTPANWAVVERMAVWQAAWGMFEAYPFLGVGPGNYPVAYADFAMPGWPNPMGHAHNLYLNFLAETGAFGLAAFLIFWLAAIRAVWRVYRSQVSETAWWQRAIPLGALGVLAYVSLHNFFDNLLVHGLNVQLALLLALATRPVDGEGKVVLS